MVFDEKVAEAVAAETTGSGELILAPASCPSPSKDVCPNEESSERLLLEFILPLLDVFIVEKRIDKGDSV